MRWIKRLLVLLVVLLLAGVGFLLWVGRELALPAQKAVGAAPADFPAETVSIHSVSGNTLAGWWRGQPQQAQARGSVLLMHGIRSNRRSLLGRARFLHTAGYNVLCLDLQAHGESTGTHITMGAHEARDAASAVTWLRHRAQGRPVIVIGTSLGGAAALMAPYETPPDAMVVEAVFSDVPTAVENRLEMRFGAPARPLASLLTIQSRLFLGIDLAALQPASAARTLTCPLLVIHGEHDQHARLAEGQAIFDNARGPKAFWAVPRAAHVDLHRHASSEYEEKVLRFLDLHVPPASGS